MAEEMIEVTILLDEEHRGHMTKVAIDLKKKGFVVNESLGEVGVLIGRAPADSLSDLSSVPGVSAVERNRTDYRTQEN